MLVMIVMMVLVMMMIDNAGEDCYDGAGDDDD